MPKFETIIKKARFDAPGYSPRAMLSIGQTTLKSIQLRWDRAQDVYDMSAPPLSKRYQQFKERRYGSGLRDLRATGRTRRGMRVLEAGQNTCTLGFSDPTAAMRVRLNNRFSRQWGLSPANLKQLAIAVEVANERPVTVVQVA